MDFLDEILAELGPEEKEQLLASAVAGLSPINEATAPGPVITTQGEVPLFPVDRFKMAPMQLPQVEFDPQNLMQTMNLSQLDRPRIQPDLTPVTVGGSVDELPVVFTPDVQAAELGGKTVYGKLPKAVKQSIDDIGMDPSTLFAEQEAEAGQTVVEQATAPASTETTEPLAEQVATSGVMQPTGVSSMDQVRMRTRGVDRTNDQYQRRLQLSRLLELQALRQLQKAEQVKAQPRSLMDLYRGGYERRAATEAQQRINMARQYFNRSGAIQRELVREKDIERKAAAAEQRAAGLDAALQEKIARRKSQEEFQDRKLEIEGQKIAASLAKLNTLTPYQRAVLANMDRKATAEQKKQLRAMGKQMRGTWQSLLREAGDDLNDLRRQKTNILGRLSSGFLRENVTNNLNEQLSNLEQEITAVRNKRDEFQQALAKQTERDTGITPNNNDAAFDALLNKGKK